MQVGSRAVSRAMLICAFMVAFVLAAWVMSSHYGVWNRFTVWVMSTQGELHRQLAAAIRQFAQEGWAVACGLIGISLLYGIFHAAGPGHGKAVITTYLGTTRTRLRRGLFLSLVSALAQGIVAVILVEIVVNLLGYSLRRTRSTAGQLENLSFALVALLGAVLAVRSAMGLYRRWRESKRKPVSLFSGGGTLQAYCAECGGPHSVSKEHISQALTWRSALPIILVIGLRPCTGALLVLLVAYSLDLRWVGIAAVLAMSLGTAATVGLLATLAVSFRHVALRFFQRGATSPMHTGMVFDMLGLSGGLLIGLMGWGLLQQGLNAAQHPLL